MSELYVTDYENHLGQFREHLSGNAVQSLPPSFIPPAGYWTSREKDRFFHALAVHSRLRPDLIADSIKSKTILDVCAYIDALDRAAASQPSLRSTLEPAVEVSDSWVDYEEEQASALMELEPGWEEEAEEQRRAVLLASRFQDEHTYWNWKEEHDALWRKQDTLAKLGMKHLRVLNRLIQNSDVKVVAPATETNSTPPHVEAASAVPNAPSSVRLTKSRFHDGLIDPALLALSSLQSPLPTPEPKEPVAPNPSTPEPRPIPMAPALPISPVSKSRRAPSDPSLRHLSPASRRRLGKRLHMRKKRAEAAGIKANLVPVKLAPGRKKTRVYIPRSRPHKYKARKLNNLNLELDTEEEETQRPNPNPSPSGSPSVQDDSDDDAIADSPNRRKGGITAPYRILSVFEDQGIGPNTLTECGLDIFNLSALGRLMGLFHSGYADPDENSVASYISLDTIKILRNTLLNFISTAVHRAISMREQEVRLKHGIKVWRLENEDEITSGNVTDALQMHGFNQQSLLSDFFEESRPKASQDENGTASADGENPSTSLEEQFIEDESTFYTRLPLHRELAPLFVPLPGKSDDISFALPDIDMDELLAELDDESKLDELDRQLDARCEKDLWQALSAG
ncbi:hypothetical protein B0H19DRAFT_1092836 [Mycena capillaripes]|nr:hypothetical protein B0H19DRAFT_1092836 [Mycena capillaripes]